MIMMTRSFFSNGIRLLTAATCALASASCGSELLRTGRAPVFLQMSNLGGQVAGGAGSGASPFRSDVQTLVDVQINGQTVQVATIFNDLGVATIDVIAKDQTGNAGTSALNSITLQRYRVSFRRTDGRNTPGVDVPFGFDGALAFTIPVGGSGSVSFDLVRHSSKSEPPLSNLAGGGGQIFISTIAEVIFFGRDQNGNEVTVTGSMDVTFADFGDE
jgi:hypothetical protein